MPREQNLAAVLLAAGYSSRAPGFKPLLPLGDSTVIENTINSFRRANIYDITVVIGHRANELIPALDQLQVRHVVNESYDQGMFSSVVAGLRSLQPGVEAFFLLPADMPLVRSRTVKLLSRAYQRADVDIVYPVFQGRRGHPPLISMRLIPAILSWNGPEGLRGLLKQYEAGSYEMAVLDEGIVMDIDTPADYHRIIESWRYRDIPTWNECDAILAKLAVPDIVVKHCRTVANVAAKLAEHLNKSGLKLDISLIIAGGLLHDLAKGKPDHAYCGARIVKRLGYPQVARIVASHTDIAFKEGFPLDEAAVVYLADKLVKHHRIVSVSERYQYSLERYAADPAALLAVRQRFLNTQRIAKIVEQIVGTSLEAVISTGC